ncbi:MAG: membrane protein insertase YidC [Proteobacteria bacterium]|nr:membrane protein insertase YidC [Pseudomonadota bacterium]
MKNENTRNTIIFFVCTAIIMVAYYFFVIQPQAKEQQRVQALQQQQAQAVATRQAVAAGVPTAPTTLPLAQALASSPRVSVDTPSVSGSIALKGARFDDLRLKKYRETTAKNSPLVELLRPANADLGYYAEFAWIVDGGGQPVPGPDAEWKVLTPGALTPAHPITLAYDTPDGLAFRRTVSVDDKYMFAVSDAVTNNSGRPRTLTAYAAVVRNGLPADLDKNAFGIHQGAIRAFGENQSYNGNNFKDWKKKREITDVGRGGWLGITDKYWMATIVPDQRLTGSAKLAYNQSGSVDIYRALYAGPVQNLAVGGAARATTRLFAGAKEDDALKAYEKSLGIPKFESAIDWGWLYILTKPMFWVLHFFYQHVGNFGVAILLLTIVVRGALFPLANQTFASGAKMKKLQPKIEELKKKYANDQTKQQQEMMALWQREKINPVAGCLPILLQIPVFFALVKLLQGTIEMRHAPFLGWIHDLSARDPSTIWNLFGLIPWDPSQVDLPLVGHLFDGNLHIGVVALLYMGMMYLQQAMTPVATDPTQQQIMKFMPLMFVFIMAIYPVGLMIYWIWSTVLSVAQQYWFMHRYKVDNPIDGLIARIRNRGADPSDTGAGASG